MSIFWDFSALLIFVFVLIVVIFINFEFGAMFGCWDIMKDKDELHNMENQILLLFLVKTCLYTCGAYFQCLDELVSQYHVHFLSSEERINISIIGKLMDF